MEVGGVCYASGSTAPAVVCHAEHRDSFSLSASLFPVFLSTHLLSLSLSLSLLLYLSLALCMPFPSLLSSACRHTLTCCMSPCGNPACHLSIYLKETRFYRLIAEPGIYRCIFIGRRLSLNNWVIQAQGSRPCCEVAWSKLPIPNWFMIHDGGRFPDRHPGLPSLRSIFSAVQSKGNTPI